MAMRTMNPVHDVTTCSVAATAEIIGAKWTALLVHDLSEGPRRFSELEHSCAGISPRTLAERLRALEHEGIGAAAELEEAVRHQPSRAPHDQVAGAEQQWPERSAPAGHTGVEGRGGRETQFRHGRSSFLQHPDG